MISEQSKSVVAGLQNPDLFGDAVDSVETLQTHMSWIFLAGPYAYKVKKPIEFEFADFSSLEKRCHFCHEELRVNRRLAPHLYLDVVPITGSHQAVQLGGDGEPIEYAVKMKRFSQRDLLIHVLERGELTREHMAALAHDVARFHGGVDVDGPDGHFGNLEAIGNPMEANFEHFEQTHLDAPGRSQVQRLKQWSEQEFTEKRDAFAARKSQGFIRECHGDMHLGNMVMEGNSVTVFDGIEFNPDLRWIDVLNEVAFLVMDVQYQEHPDLGHRFLNCYLEHTGDYQGLVVFPYYQVYRALVRAKVSSIRLGQTEPGEETRRSLHREIGRHLAVAERFTQPPPPRLLITHGLSGSGKSYGTERLVDQHGMIRIRSDVERKRLFGYQQLDRTESGIAQDLYSPAGTQRTYQQLANLASASVRAGFSVIVDATFLKRDQRDLMRRTAEQLQVPFRILDFQATAETLRRRLLARGRHQSDASEADVEVMSHQAQVQEPLGQDEQQEAIAIDTESADASDWITRL